MLIEQSEVTTSKIHGWWFEMTAARRAQALVVASLLLTLLAFPFNGSCENLSNSAAAEMEAIAKSPVADSKLAGLAVMVANGEGVQFEGYYGHANLELDVPVNAASVFRVGSVTKQFTAVGILMLAEEGKLTLEDKLSKYFPEFPRGDEISIRQILNHTSGIRSFTGKGAIPKEIYRNGITVPVMVNLISGLGYDFSPGQYYKYSNSGYFLAGAIIERVSGKDLATLFKDRIFSPLGMHDTALDTNGDVVNGRVSGYKVTRDGNGSSPRFLNADYTDMSVPFGAGAIRSTVRDLVLWNSAVHGGKVLASSSYAELTTPSLRPQYRGQNSGPGSDAKPSRYALGLLVEEKSGHAVVFHGGTIDGFDATLMYFPDSATSVAAITNTQGGNMRDDVVDPIIAALLKSHN